MMMMMMMTTVMKIAMSTRLTTSSAIGRIRLSRQFSLFDVTILLLISCGCSSSGKNLFQHVYDATMSKCNYTSLDVIAQRVVQRQLALKLIENYTEAYPSNLEMFELNEDCLRESEIEFENGTNKKVLIAFSANITDSNDSQKYKKRHEDILEIESDLLAHYEPESNRVIEVADLIRRNRELFQQVAKDFFISGNKGLTSHIQRFKALYESYHPYDGKAYQKLKELTKGEVKLLNDCSASLLKTCEQVFDQGHIVRIPNINIDRSHCDNYSALQYFAEEFLREEAPHFSLLKDIMSIDLEDYN